MKFYHSLLFVLFFSSIVKAQCPVIDGAMVKICGANEGLNEFVLFTTTASATAGDYTVYYGDNSTPSLGFPVSILAGVNAAIKNGSGSITSTSGCVINQVTSAAAIIPANSRVVFIPSNFDASYDVSAICTAGNVFIVYIDVTPVPSVWNAAGVLANTPTVTSYLQIANGAALCSSAVRNYDNYWASNINGNSVWWDGTGNASYLNNGCSLIVPPVTISNFTALPVCAGTAATTASYTTTGTPDEYSLVWNATAITAGFLNITGAVLPASPLTIAVPSGAAAATYTASLFVKNTVSGISSVPQNISLTIDAPVTPLFAPVAPICSMDAAPILPLTSTNGISGTWSPAVVSNTLSGSYTFTPSAGFCATATSLPVTILPLPTASVIGTATICYGTSSNIIFNGTPNAAVTYNINGGANQIIGLNGFGFTTISTGNLFANTTFNLVGIATATCSQPQTGSAIITVLSPVANLSAASTAVCNGTGTNIIFNGTPDAVISYNINGGASQTVLSDGAGMATVATGNLTTTTTYNLETVTTTGAPVCSQPATGSVTVTVIASPTVSISGSATICSGTGTNIIFNGTPNAVVTYNINGGVNQTILSDAAGTATIATGNLTVAATYNLVSVATTGIPVCTQPASGAAVVSVKALPTATISGTVAICNGTSTNIIFNGTPNAVVTYNINGGANQTAALNAAGTVTVATANLTSTTMYNLVSVATTTAPVCSQPVSGTATVTVAAAPFVSISGTATICSGSNSNIIFNGTADAVVAYNINGGVSQTIALDAAGTATLTTPNLTDDATYNLVSITTTGALICSKPATGSAIVTVNALPTAAISGTASICNGTSTIIVFKGTPNAGIIYTIDGGANQNIQLDAAGNAAVNTGNLLVTTTYNLVSVTSSGLPVCSQNISGQVLITVQPVTAAPAVNSAVTLCQKEKAIPLTATGSNLLWYTSSTGGMGTAIAPIPVTTVAAVTDYYVTQTINLCESQRVSITVTVNATPVIPSVPMTAVFRCGAGQVTLKAAAPGMVQWYSDAALTQFIAAGTSFVTTITATTTFYVTNTEGNCVSPVRSVTAIVFPLVIQVTAFSYNPATVCAGSAKPVPVAAAGFIKGGVYSSTAGLSFNSNTGVINPLLSTPGTYVVKYALGAAICTPAASSTTTITITKSTVPVTAFSYTSPVCTSAASLSPVRSAGFATGGLFISSAGLSINAATGVIDLKTSNAGTYTVTYTVAPTPCTTAGTSNTVITITSPPAPTVASGIQRCGSGVVTLSGTATGVIKWYSDAGLTNLLLQGSSYTPSINATTTFYVTNTVGTCISPVDSTVATVLPITAQVTDFSYNTVVVCTGSKSIAPVPATGFVQGGIYSSAVGLSLNSTTGVIKPAESTPATYIIKYTAAASVCASAGSSTTTITISTAISTVTTFSYASPACTNGANPLPLLPAGFTTGGSFASTTGLVINAATGSIDLTTSTPGTYSVTYTVTATSCTNGGSSKAAITIAAPPAAPVTISSQRCGNGIITLNATGSGVIKWYADAGLTNLLAEGTAYLRTINATTIFYVTDNAGNCASPVATITATVIPVTVQVTAFSYNPSVVCIGSAKALPIAATGFVQGGSYLSAAGLSLNNSTGAIDPLTSTAGTYIVKYSLPAPVCAFADYSTTTITINNPAVTVTTFSYASPVCTGGANPFPVLSAGFTGGGSFSSAPGLSINATTGNIDVTKSTAGTYTVTYTVAATACITGGSSKAAITIVTFIAAPLTRSNQRCGSGEITLNASAASILKWYSSTDLKTMIATGSTYSPFVNTTTDYYVTANSGSCESAPVLVTATVLAMPLQPDLGKLNTLCAGDKLVLSPGIYDNYLWQDKSTLPTFTVTAPGQYSLMVKSANGCTNAAGISITASNICDDILFPSAFSPNGDNLNDNFGPLPLRNLGYVKNYTLRIFNRYGQVVFKTTDPYKKWDGMYLGQVFDTGSFMWYAEYIYNNGGTKSQKGYVIIVQ